MKVTSCSIQISYDDKVTGTIYLSGENNCICHSLNETQRQDLAYLLVKWRNDILSETHEQLTETIAQTLAIEHS